MEPMTSTAVQYLVLGIQLSAVSLFSLPIIVFGAIGFSGDPLYSTGLSVGTLMAFLSNVILALKNQTLKGKESSSQATVTPRSMSNFLSLGVCVVGLSIYTWDKVKDTGS